MTWTAGWNKRSVKSRFCANDKNYSSQACDKTGSSRRPSVFWRRCRSVAIVALLGVAVVVFGPAPSASAHATLLTTSPPAGYTTPVAPTGLTLIFDEPVAVSAQPLVLSGSSGRLSIGPVLKGQGGRELSGEIPEHLSGGSYQVHWEVTATDGDVVDGDFRFGVGTGPSALTGAPATSGPSATRGLTSVAFLRWALFAGLALALGGLFGDRLARRARDARPKAVPPPLVRPPLLTGATLGLIAALGLGVHLAGAGSLTTGLRRVSVTTFTSTAAGRLVGLEVLGFGVAAIAAIVARWTRRQRAAEVGVAVALVVAAFAEGFRGHPHAAAGGWGASLTVVHLLGAAIWAGALWHVVRVALGWRTEPRLARILVASYAKIALRLFLVVIITGTIVAILLLPTVGSLFTTGYGQLLLAKLGVVGVVSGLALLGQRSLRRPAKSAAGRQPSRPTQAERFVLASVLAVTAVLVSVAPPAPNSTAFAAPPPPVGPVVPVGTLAGEITVGALASTGQLLVQLTAPSTGDGQTDTTRYGLTAFTYGDTERSQQVALQRCGPGCYLGHALWAPGHNRVHLDVRAAGWTGGSVDLDVVWPPRPAPELLSKVLAAIRNARQVTVYEAVTSNTARPTPPTQTLTLSADSFIASEPYAKGIAPNVVDLGQDNGARAIALAYPSQGFYIVLYLRPDLRIDREVLTTPEHLISRTFSYPG